jgi:hypothetical protein
MYNNDSSTLTAANDTTAAAFIARRVRDPAADDKLHWYRHEAWNEGNHNATHIKEYTDANPAGYVVEPMVIPEAAPAAAGGAAAAAFIAKRNGEGSDPPIPLHWYRHESWNEANHNATHIAEYNADTPAAYLTPPMDIASSQGGADQPPAAFIVSGNKARSIKATTNKAAQGEPIGFIMRKLRSKLPGSEATYAIPDSHSWIEPYFPRDHAYTWPQY